LTCGFRRLAFERLFLGLVLTQPYGDGDDRPE
jgi:hypothetical protein